MGQAALTTLVARPETAIRRLVDVFNNPHDPPSFLDLPGECRNEIYKLCFSDYPKIVVTRNLVNHAGNTRYYEQNVESYITHVLRFNRNLLMTCKAIRSEATPLLSMACTLVVCAHYERANPITRVPTIHLLGLKRLEVEVHTFIWVPRELLPSLNEVTLTHSNLYTDGMLQHTLGCPRCGDEAQLLTDLVFDIEDWEWKRKQFMHTARAEGFKIQLAVKAFDYGGERLTFTINIEECRIKHITADDCGGDVRTFTGLDVFRKKWHFDFDD